MTFSIRLWYASNLARRCCDDDVEKTVICVLAGRTGAGGCDRCTGDVVANVEGSADCSFWEVERTGLLLWLSA